MINQFEDYIFQNVDAAKHNEVQEILSIFNEEKFDKGDLFKKQDTIIQNLGFLIEGSSRSFFINENGDEITDEVLQKNNFIGDIISIRSQNKSPIIIEMLEQSSVLTAPMIQVRDLLNKNLTFNILVREYMGYRSMQLLKRHLMFLNGSATERYQYLITTNPSLLEKFPLKYIASMIGVTPTQLSRIRSNKS